MARPTTIAQQQLKPGQKLPIPVQLDPAKLTPVFGTAEPARGLPEMIRRVAYGFPVHKPERWLLLVVADRVASGEIVIREAVTPGEQGLVFRHFRRQIQAHSVGAAITAITPLMVGGAFWLIARRRLRNETPG